MGGAGEVLEPVKPTCGDRNRNKDCHWEGEYFGWEGMRELSRATEMFCLDLCVTYPWVYAFPKRLKLFT